MEWRSIAGYEDRYEISDTGLVRNVKTKRILKPATFTNGYIGIKLGKASKCYMLHRLVLSAFKPTADCSNLQVNHVDGDKTNNSLVNLEWCTQSANVKHSYDFLHRKKHKWTTKTKLVKNAVEYIFESRLAAAKFLGVVAGSIASAITNKHKCKGYEVCDV